MCRWEMFGLFWFIWSMIYAFDVLSTKCCSSYGFELTNVINNNKENKSNWRYMERSIKNSKGCHSSFFVSIHLHIHTLTHILNRNIHYTNDYICVAYNMTIDSINFCVQMLPEHSVAFLNEKNSSNFQTNHRGRNM